MFLKLSLCLWNLSNSCFMVGRFYKWLKKFPFSNSFPMLSYSCFLKVVMFSFSDTVLQTGGGGGGADFWWLV